MNINNNIPAVVSMSQMAKFLKLSRSRLYQLVDAGILLPPAYLLSNRRPIYTRDMAMCNLDAKYNNTGVNGQVVMFYSARNVVHSASKLNQRSVPKPKTNKSGNKHKSLIEELECLGLEDVAGVQIDDAIAELFPDGTANISQDDILVSVFRHIKCQNSNDNVNR
jgi:hypothetical protein